MSPVNVISALLLLLAAVLPAISESQCKVSDFRVQRNFDIARFQGRWFIHEKFTQAPLLQDSFTNREHIYTKGAGEDIAALSFGRCADGSCVFQHGKLEQPTTTGSDAAKLLYQPSTSDPALNYWVIDTDYENYALIYGCNRIKQSTGKCLEAYSWVLQRTRRPSLSENIQRRIDRKITGLCLEPNDFHVVSQDGERCRQCDRSTWTVEPNFDLDRYLGLWHEMVFKPRVVFPRELSFNDYLNIYTILPNGTIAIRIVRSDPVLNDKCFLTDDRQTLERTDEPGKLIFFDSTDRTVHIGDDFFVIETDYTGISFVLGCVREPDTPPGECVRIRGSVWSRKPYFTSGEFIRLKELFDQYCLDEQEYYITTHDKICPRVPNGEEQIEVCVLYDKPDVCLRGA